VAVSTFVFESFPAKFVNKQSFINLVHINVPLTFSLFFFWYLYLALSDAARGPQACQRGVNARNGAPRKNKRNQKQRQLAKKTRTRVLFFFLSHCQHLFVWSFIRFGLFGISEGT
jgi:hypothetical protein